MSSETDLSKLSKVQKGALEKLSNTEWKSAYEIGESLPTLFSLKKRSLVKSILPKGTTVVWSGFSDRTDYKFKKVQFEMSSETDLDILSRENDDLRDMNEKLKTKNDDLKYRKRELEDLIDELLNSIDDL